MISSAPREPQGATVFLPFPNLLHERENDGDFRKYYELRTIDTGDPVGGDEMHPISVRVLKYIDSADPSI